MKKNEPVKFKIEESFLEFCLLSDHLASGFTENTKNYGLDINNLRGQGYDGVIVISGV